MAETPDYINEEVQFKSEREHFFKEQSGLKPFTIREKDLEDLRFQLLQVMYTLKQYGTIKIINKDTGAYFTRRITDISLYKNYVLITWNSDLTLMLDFLVTYFKKKNFYIVEGKYYTPPENIRISPKFIVTQLKKHLSQC